MKNNYLKNVMKSVAYAASDVAISYTPSLNEFKDANKEFTTATYAALRNPKQFVRKQVEAIQESKIYKALDYGAKNLVEDLRTGNFYNKARKERDEVALSGLDTNWDDLSEFGIDNDWESKLDSSDSKNTEVTAGDMKIVEAVEGSNAALASATVNAVISSSDNEIKAGKTNTAMIYTQNERLFGGLHKDISVLGNTMQQMYNLQSASLQNIDKNMSNFFTQESKLSAERNAILKEMLELQRNVYKSASDKEKEKQKASTRIRWGDISSNGIPNLSEYFKAVKKNINNELSSYLPAGFGEDSNMLATFMTSPLEGVMKYIVDGIIPSTVKVAAKEFNGTISGVFGNIIGELGNARSKNEGGLLGTLAKFLGVSTSVNRNIDTSRYEKGPVPFDGITRKAIIDVIPTHLRRIEAAITGRQEEMFDYKAGRWVKVNDLQKQYNDIKKNAIKRATSELRTAMNPGAKAIRDGIDSNIGKKSWDKALEEFEEYLYNNNGRFNPKASAAKNGIDKLSYPNLYDHYSKIKTVFTSFGGQDSEGRNGKTITRNTMNRIRMQLSNAVLDAKENEEAQYRNIETDVGNALTAFFGSPKHDVHGKEDKGVFKAYNNLNTTTDDKGNTIFNYLQNINKELTWMRLNGVPGGGYGNGANKYNRESIDFKDIDITNPNKKTNNFAKEAADDERIKKAALEAIKSGKAIDLRDFNVDEQAYLLQLSNMIKNNSLKEYADEIDGYNSSNVITGFLDKHYIKTNIKSLKDVEKAIEKADKEGKNTNEVKMDAKEETFFRKIMNRIGQGESILGGIVGASSEAFTNLLYTADKAIYEMMYKTEIDGDESKKKYKGFMDMIVNKTTDTFKVIKDKLKEDLIDPFLDRFGLNDKLDNFKERFKGSLKNTGSKLWTVFKDSNTSVYGPLLNQLKVDLGFEDGETTAQKRRAGNRSNLKTKIDHINKAENIWDDNFSKILREYGYNPMDYANNVDEVKKLVISQIAKDMFKNSNLLREYDNDNASLDLMFQAMKENPEFIEKFSKAIGVKVKGTTIDEQVDFLKNQHAMLTDKSKGARHDREYALAAKGEDGIISRQLLADEGSFGDSIEEKRARLSAISKWLGVDVGDLSKLDNDDALNKSILRQIEKTNAKGTSGKPFSGTTYLTKNEVVFGAGGASIVPKTGKYYIDKPSHILNTEQTHSLGLYKGPKVSVSQAYNQEKAAARRNGDVIASHADGTGKNGVKISSDVSSQTKEILAEAKNYIPEAAAGGLVGGIISTLLGVVGGPLIGAAVGAGGTLLAGSNTLKEKLFGKVGEDGKRDGSGFISKTIMDKVRKYFPDMTKYGLAGLIPGLLTPLGPVGGILAGAAFGFLKNNEKFTNKYFGEEGKLTIGSKEKKIIQDLLPGAGKGALIGALSTLLLPTPFGLLGNAALGAGLGMIASTEDFKNFILGTEDENGDRMGGIVGAFKDAMKPFTDSLKEAGSTLVEAFDKNIIAPIANLVTPAIHALPIALGSLPRFLSEKFDKFFDTRIGRTLETIIHDKVGKAAGWLGKPFKWAANGFNAVTSLPGKAITGIGNKLRAYDIRHGDLVDMDAREAVGWMKRTGREDQIKHGLDVVAKIGTTDENGVATGATLEQAKQLLSTINLRKDNLSSAQSKFKKANSDLNKLLVGFESSGSGRKLDPKTIKKVLAATRNGKFEDVSKILQKSGLTQSEFDELMNTKGLKNSILDAVGKADNVRALEKYENADEEGKAKIIKERDELIQKLTGKGGVFEGVDLNDKYFAKFLKDQITHLEVNQDEIDPVDLQKESNKHVASISEKLTKLLELEADIAQGKYEEAAKKAEDVKGWLNDGETKANEVYDENIARGMRAVSDVHGEDTASKIATNVQGSGADLLSTGKHDINAVRFGTDALNKTIDKFKNERKAFGAFVDDKIAKYLTPEAWEKLSKLTKRSASTIKSGFVKKNIRQAILVGKYEITPEVIDFFTSGANIKDLEDRCQVLAQAYRKQIKGESISSSSIYSRYKSLLDIAKLSNKELGAIIDEFDIDYSDLSASIVKNLMRHPRKYVKIAKNGVKTVKGYTVDNIIKPSAKWTKDKVIDPSAKWTKDKVIDPAAEGATKVSKDISDAYKEKKYGIHSDEWHEKNDPKNLMDYATNSSENLMDYATTPTPSNSIGTILSTAFGIGKSVLGGIGKVAGGIGKGVNSLFKGGEEGAAKSPGILGALGGMMNAGKSVLGGNSVGGDLEGNDAIDKKGDNRNTAIVDGNLMQVTRDSSGNVEYDTSDSDTKTALNKLSFKEKMAQKVQEAQLKTSELIKKTFDTSALPESKGGKIGLLGLLAGGALLWKSGILKKLYEGFIKPVWTDHVKPWITEKAVPWISDFWTNKAMPAIQKGLGYAIGLLVKALPDILLNSLKALPRILAGFGDAITGNSTNVGGKTTVEANTSSEDYDPNHKTGMINEKGEAITSGDLASGNYKEIYNSEGVQGVVNEDGTVTFHDTSVRGSSYAKTTLNTVGHSFAKSMATGKSSKLVDLAVKGSNKLAKSKGLLGKSAGLAGKMLTKPAQWAGNLGVKARAKTDKLVNKTTTDILSKAKANGAQGEELQNLYKKLAHGDGSKATEVVQSISGSNNKGLVNKVKAGVDRAKNFVKTKTDGLKGKIKNIFKEGSEDAIEEAAEKLTKEGIQKGTKEVVDTVVKEGTEGATKAAGKNIAKTTAKVTDAASDVAKATAKKAGKDGGLLTKLCKRLGDAIKKLFENSKVTKMLTKLGTSLGKTNIGKWLIGIKESIEKIFKEALEKGIKKAGASTAKNVLSKALWWLFLITDFLTGCDQAESILGVSETSIVEEVIAGLINALCNLLIIPAIFPGVPWIAKFLFKLFGKDLEERQKKADEEYEKWKEETGSTLTKEEYLKRQHSITGKIGGWFSDQWAKITGKNKKKAKKSNGQIIVEAATKANAESNANGTLISSNAEGTLSPNNVATGSIDILKNTYSSIGDISNNLGKDDKLEKTMKKTSDGKISIFSKEYWKSSNDSDTSLAGVLKKSRSMITKLTNLPIFMIKSSLQAMTGGIEEIANALSEDGTVSNDTKKSNSSKENKSFLGKIKSFFSSAGKKIKGFFGAGTSKYGTGKYSKQIDPSVANIRFNSNLDSDYQTIGDSGCGPAAAVNALESMYGRGNKIASAARFALKRGYKETNGGTEPGFFGDYFNANGYSSQTTSNKSKLEQNIRNGIPTVIMGKDSNGVSSSSPFGTNPHYVTVTGVDGRGNAIVQDPESRYDNQLYPVDSLMKQTSFGSSVFGRSVWGKGTYDANIWWYLKQLGMTDAGAAGMMGNLSAESGLHPDRVQGDIPYSQASVDYTKKVDNGSISKDNFINKGPGGGGYGLAQWTYYTRKQGLYNLAKSRNTSIADIGTQLQWLGTELNGYTSVMNTLKTTNDIQAASDIVLTQFERPANQGASVKAARKNLGQGFFNTYKGTKGTEITGSVLPGKSTLTGTDSTTDTSSGSTDTSANTSTESSNSSDIFSYVSSEIDNVLGDKLSNITNKLSEIGDMSKYLKGFNIPGSQSSSGETSGTDESNANNSSTNSKYADKMVEIAKNELNLGIKENPLGSDNVKYNDWYYGKKNNAAWCAAFVSWVANQAGVPTDVIPKYAYTPTGYNFFKNAGREVDKTKAKAGDILFTYSPSAGRISHTGIVTGMTGKAVDSIEGNWSNKVSAVRRGPTKAESKNVDASEYNNLHIVRPNYGTGNKNKPLSKYGQFKNSIYNSGIKSENMHYSVNDDSLKQTSKNTAKNNTNETTTPVFGMAATSSIDYTKLINSIIAILMTIADNTDKLNTIVNILNKKLNLNISASDVSNETSGKQTLKSKLATALNGINNSSTANSQDNSINAIITAMNAIASE